MSPQEQEAWRKILRESGLGSDVNIPAGAYNAFKGAYQTTTDDGLSSKERLDAKMKVMKRLNAEPPPEDREAPKLYSRLRYRLDAELFSGFSFGGPDLVVTCLGYVSACFDGPTIMRSC